MCPIEFRYALLHYNKGEETHIKLLYTVARYLATHIWNSAGRSLQGKRIITPEEVNTFSWEKEVSNIDKMKVQLMNIAVAYRDKPVKERKR